MPYGESKNKLGNRGSIKGEKTFNTKSGKQDWASKKVQDSWEGTTKGKTTEKD